MALPHSCTILVLTIWSNTLSNESSDLRDGTYLFVYIPDTQNGLWWIRNEEVIDK